MGGTRNRGQSLSRAQYDSRIFHTSEDLGWLAHPGQVIPGGAIENVDQNERCTVGWIVSDDAHQYILTAGHCGDRGDTMAITDAHGNSAIVGTVVESEFTEAGGVDYGLIQLDDDRYVNEQPPFTQLRLTRWEDSRWLRENRPQICHLGVRTGLSCGEFLGVDGPVLTFRGIVDHGDSGGPVFAVVDEDLVAVGIISYLQTDDATRVAAVTLGDPMREWGLTLNG